MNQRGQFYLIAALLAVAVLLSMGTVFTRARVPQQDSSVSALADEIRDEAFNLMNRDSYQRNTTDETWSRIDGLMQNYSLVNPQHDIVVIYGNSTKLIAQLYTLGRASPLTSGAIYNSSTITLTYGGPTYTFYRTRGSEFHLLLKKEGENGKTIITR